MGLGAVVIIAGKQETFGPPPPQETGQDLLTQPLSCVEVLGRSVIERMIERLLNADVEAISVQVAEDVEGTERLRNLSGNVSVQVVSDVLSATTQVLSDYAQRGIEHSFVASSKVYAETDLLDFFYFHREARQAVTRAQDAHGPLDLWVGNCRQAERDDFTSRLVQSKGNNASYFVREYVNRLAHPRDLRQLATDVLRGRCIMRPAGREIKPGIWIGEGAEIHRRARIVAPAYIGRGTRVREDSLITRCSNLESDCQVEAGTVIEDSYVLPNTHIGIWLDVCHAIANGNKLFSLERNVVIEISDASVMRSNGAARKAAKNDGRLARETQEQPAVVSSKSVVSSKKETPAPENWQLGANPIQG